MKMGTKTQNVPHGDGVCDTGCWHWSNDNLGHIPLFETNDIIALKQKRMAACE
jgi:hypothetical protein